MAAPPLSRSAPGADAVLLAPSRDLAASRAPRRNPKPRHVVDPLADLYAGHDGLLVRTALIRSDRYEAQRKRMPAIGSSRDIEALCAHLKHADREFMVTLALNARREVLAIYETAAGGVASTDVEMAQVFKVALLTAGSAVVVVHNHPSGDPAPSSEDMTITRALIEAGRCINIPVLDHVIVALDGYFSFLDARLLTP